MPDTRKTKDTCALKLRLKANFLEKAGAGAAEALEDLRKKTEVKKF